jgi:hypothetical protein
MPASQAGRRRFDPGRPLSRKCTTARVVLAPPRMRQREVQSARPGIRSCRTRRVGRWPCGALSRSIPSVGHRYQVPVRGLRHRAEARGQVGAEPRRRATPASGGAGTDEHVDTERRPGQAGVGHRDVSTAFTKASTCAWPPASRSNLLISFRTADRNCPSGDHGSRPGADSKSRRSSPGSGGNHDARFVPVRRNQRYLAGGDRPCARRTQRSRPARTSRACRLRAARAAPRCVPPRRCSARRAPRRRRG